jgi:hypothetical protein
MAWKTFTFYEPHYDGGTSIGANELTVAQQLDKIEAEGYEIRFVERAARQYTVLARKKAH